MKIFVAGATGALGARLVPMLVDGGHDVVAMTRSPRKADGLRALGAQPAVADGLDRGSVMQAVMRAEPEVVIHQMTALGNASNMKRFDDEFALTNRLRTEGTDHLLAAARAAGARRLVVQSYAAWPYERTGGAVKTEDDPLDPHPPANQRQTLAAIRHAERPAFEGGDLDVLALRYGAFYGPGTGFAPGGDTLELVARRKLPIVGDGAGVWSFVHIDDAASATAAAVDHGAAGVYNVADDEPAPVSEWLPDLAAAIGAKAPRHIPLWLGRLAIGEVGISLMTQIRGAANAKARRELLWTPRYATWRDGFRTGLDGPPAARRESGPSQVA
jgi:nucleoside-diphosphate-sugar epimerase